MTISCLIKSLKNIFPTNIHVTVNHKKARPVNLFSPIVDWFQSLRSRIVENNVRMRQIQQAMLVLT